MIKKWSKNDLKNLEMTKKWPRNDLENLEMTEKWLRNDQEMTNNEQEILLITINDWYHPFSFTVHEQL